MPQSPSVKDSGVPVSVWIEKISLVALPVLFQTFLRNGRFRLHYTSAGRTGRAAIAILRLTPIVKGRLELVKITGYHLRVDSADSPRLKIQITLPNRFNELFFTLHQAKVDAVWYPDSTVSPARVRIGLEKISASQILDFLTLREVGQEWHQANKISVDRMLLIAPSADLASAIPTGWAKDKVESATVWNSGNSLFLRMVRATQNLLANGLRPRWKDQGRLPSVGTAITSVIDRANRSDDLFWWWDSGIPANQMVLFADRRDSPVSKELVEQIDSLGMDLVVMDAKAEGSAPNLFRWRASPGPAVSIRRFWDQMKILAGGIGRDSVRRWLACRISDLHYNSSGHSDFLEEFNIKGLFHYQDAGMDSLSIACDVSGAARIGWHYSHIPWPFPYHKRLHQVYFTWGSHYAEILHNQGHSVDYLLYSGCAVPKTHPSQPADDTALSARSAAAANGASRFLALFDTSLPTENFYRFFLQKAIQDSRWGLLIKPKTRRRPWEMFNLPDLAGLYERAAATGRVQMLDPKISPAAAAAAADLALSVDLNSASVVTALAGFRGIHLDYLRSHKSSLSEFADFYRDGPDRVVFNDPETLWESINRYFDEPGSQSDLGLPSQQILEKIDHFRDGQAPNRIGQYVAWYLEALAQDQDRDSALNSASQKYADRWGRDAVAIGATSTMTKSQIRETIG